MKKKNKEIIDNITYSENDEAKKTLNSVKRSNRIFYLIYILGTISYILLIINVIHIQTVMFLTMLYLVIIIDLSLSQRKFITKVIMEAKNTKICPDAFLNLNLYNAKRLLCGERKYNYSLNNIANYYIQVGELEKAKKIIKYLDTRKKDLILQSQIMQNKIEIAFMKNDKKAFNRESENLRKILVFIPKKYKKQAKLNINLKQAVIENDEEKVDELSDLFIKKNRYNEIVAAYYKGSILEKNENESYQKYYRFVAENGNNLMIANEARKKLNINEVKNVYKRKIHMVHKIIQLIMLLLMMSNVLFWSMYTIYKYSK